MYISASNFFRMKPGTVSKISKLYILRHISEIFILFNEDPVENMLQIVTIRVGFNIIVIRTSGLNRDSKTYIYCW